MKWTVPRNFSFHTLLTFMFVTVIVSMLASHSDKVCFKADHKDFMTVNKHE